MNISEKAIFKINEILGIGSPVIVIISDKGKDIQTLSSEKFMVLSKEKYGGRNKFLDDYIDLFNKDMISQGSTRRARQEIDTKGLKKSNKKLRSLGAI